jgi:hypothetical protein
VTSRDTWARVAAHAAQRHGVVGVVAAREELELSVGQLGMFERARRLRQAAPSAYVIAGSQDTWRQRAMIAAVSAQGWISHRSAAVLWQIGPPDHKRLEVLVPHGPRRVKRSWKVHSTRRLASVDEDVVDNIPCTAVPRTLIDLAAVAHPFVVNKALDDACRRWPEMLDLVTARFRELAGRGRRGTRLMRSMLEERLGTSFTQTDFEEITRKLAVSVGLPPPTPQCLVRDDEGPMYLDLGWPDIRWAVECDSLAWHSGKNAHEGDRARRRRLKALGWDLVEVTFDDVTKRATQTSDQLRTLYDLRKATPAPQAT